MCCCFQVAGREPQQDDTFQRLSANVSLALISAYIATWNPPSSDKRFLEEVDLAFDIIV